MPIKIVPIWAIPEYASNRLMFRCAIATILPYSMDRMAVPIISQTHSGLKPGNVEKSMRNKIANAAPFGAIERKAVTGVGAPW